VNSAEDKFLSVLAIVAVVWLTWGMFRFHMKAPVNIPNSPVAEVKINSLMEAIATAEGYYAPGSYDGHSLPYKLNNPGSLKKPALGAESLPTWKDTGLIIFPTVEMGRAALRHQLELMLNGDSGVYDPSDTLLAVADKYAAGDLNWGRRVAATLGLKPTVTLAEIAEQFPLPPAGTTESAAKPPQPVSIESPARIAQPAAVSAGCSAGTP
jgi:hypothetical protein